MGEWGKTGVILCVGGGQSTRASPLLYLSSPMRCCVETTLGAVLCGPQGSKLDCFVPRNDASRAKQEGAEMAYVNVLDAIPDQITVGESVSWKYSNTDYPASAGWALTYTLIRSTARIQIVSTADGDDHLIEVAATVSALYTAGTYDWQAHISNGTERYQVADGVIEVLADFAASGLSGGFDARSHVKKVLDALEAAIEGRASKTQINQSVGGMTIGHMTLADQVAMRDKYRAKYQQELVAAGKAKSRTIIRSRFYN